MKKLGVLFVIVFLMVSFVSAIENPLEEPVKKVEKVKDKIFGTKWDYLGEEWKKMFLGNPVIAGIDKFLNMISPVFEVFVGLSYDFSGGFFLVLVLWIYFLFWFYEVFKKFSMFQKSTAFFVAFLINVMLSHLQFYVMISGAIIYLIFVPKGWVFNLLVGLFIMLFFIVLFKFGKPLGELAEKVASGRGKIEKARKEYDKAAREHGAKSFLQKLGALLEREGRN